MSVRCNEGLLYNMIIVNNWRRKPGNRTPDVGGREIGLLQASLDIDQNYYGKQNHSKYL